MNDSDIDGLLYEIALGTPYRLRGSFRKTSEEEFYRRGILYLKDDLQLIKQPFNNSPVLQLTPYGSNVIKDGGWLIHIRSQRKAAADAEDTKKKKELAEYDSLTTTTMVNKWLFKTRYLPHILSLLSIAVSIVIGLYTVHLDREKQSLEKKLRELELRIKTNERKKQYLITDKANIKSWQDSISETVKPIISNAKNVLKIDKR